MWHSRATQTPQPTLIGAITKPYRPAIQEDEEKKKNPRNLISSFAFLLFCALVGRWLALDDDQLDGCNPSISHSYIWSCSLSLHSQRYIFSPHKIYDGRTWIVFVHAKEPGRFISFLFFTVRRRMRRDLCEPFGTLEMKSFLYVFFSSALYSSFLFQNIPNACLLFLSVKNSI